MWMFFFPRSLSSCYSCSAVVGVWEIITATTWTMSTNFCGVRAESSSPSRCRSGRVPTFEHGLFLFLEACLNSNVSCHKLKLLTDSSDTHPSSEILNSGSHTAPSTRHPIGSALVSVGYHHLRFNEGIQLRQECLEQNRRSPRRPTIPQFAAVSFQPLNEHRRYFIDDYTCDEGFYAIGQYSRDSGVTSGMLLFWEDCAARLIWRADSDI
ncbi:hypothetical protein B0H13DRAFT_1893095 [Mycena leptocephala]|nr:hypothetical protein B0H13DRAFT_1893095 [Mycena leptocephala]